MKKVIFAIICFLIVMLSFSRVGFCQDPPKSFLDLSIGYSKDAGEITLNQFINVIKPGNWEKIDNSQWIYRFKSFDPLTSKVKDISLLFVRSKGGVAEGITDKMVGLHRMTVNGNELSFSELNSKFYRKVIEAIRNGKQRTDF